METKINKEFLIKKHYLTKERKLETETSWKHMDWKWEQKWNKNGVWTGTK